MENKTKEELERLASDEVNELCKNHILKQDEKYYARLGFIRGYQQAEINNRDVFIEFYEYLQKNIVMNQCIPEVAINDFIRDCKQKQ